MTFLTFSALMYLLCRQLAVPLPHVRACPRRRRFYRHDLAVHRALILSYRGHGRAPRRFRRPPWSSPACGSSTPAEPNVGDAIRVLVMSRPSGEVMTRRAGHGIASPPRSRLFERTPPQAAPIAGNFKWPGCRFPRAAEVSAEAPRYPRDLTLTSCGRFILASVRTSRSPGAARRAGRGALVPARIAQLYRRSCDLQLRSARSSARPSRPAARCEQGDEPQRLHRAHGLPVRGHGHAIGKILQTDADPTLVIPDTDYLLTRCRQRLLASTLRLTYHLELPGNEHRVIQTP